MNVMAARWARLYRGTPAEHALEDAVAALGVPYRTQMPLFLYGARWFPDFVLPTLGVVIEVDDPSHRKGDRPEEDALRTEDLQRRYGWTVVRCTNAEAHADPRGTVARMMSEAGWSSAPLSPRTLAESLPRQQKCPPRERRHARLAVRKAKRAGRTRRTRRRVSLTA